MQEAAFQALGIKAFYAAFELEPPDFHKALKKLRSFLVEGFNVTVPYKEAVMKYLDGITPEARAIGAVNTVFRKGSQWTGTNTDVTGFLTSLKTEGRFLAKGKTALVFGAGGAARAVLYGLAKEGVSEIFVVNRHPERAKKLVRDFEGQFSKTTFHVCPFTGAVKDLIAEADLVVNATSVGLKQKDRLCDPSWIPSAGKTPKLFFDLIYHPVKTGFLLMAARKGHRILGGAGMLLFQGAEAFRLWTGKKPPVNVMRKALLGAIVERAKGAK